MSETIITCLPDPSGKSCDPLTALLRQGARDLIAQAVEAELAAFLEDYRDEQDDQGRRRLVRHGYLPERDIQTGIGSVKVKVPRIRDRGAASAGEPIKFRSALLPPYLRRTKSVEELIPWLYLKGVSTGDFSEALAALLGKDAPGLSPSTVGRLKVGWETEYETWRKRDLSARRFVYLWADGIYITPRMEERQCLLVIIGADDWGHKDILAISDGYRESTQSWRELLLDLKARGLTEPPELAIGDGAMGFWAALSEIYPQTRGQHCWVHKVMNVLNAMPKSVAARAKAGLHDIWMADTRAEAEKAFDLFVESDSVKYQKAVEKLTKDRETLLAFYDFPAEHWKQVRTTNPIESAFATIRHRTNKTRGCLSRTTALAMIYRLALSAKKKWRRLDGPNRLPEISQGVVFKDGICQKENAA
jgi:putative transposase